MPDILILDADGVTNPLRFSDFTHFGLDTGTTDAFFNGPFRERCLTGADTKAELAAFVAERGLMIDVDAIMSYWHKDQQTTYPQVLESVQKLRRSGVYAALATNQDAYRLAFMKTDMGYGDVFDQIFCSCEIGVTKPDAQFFREVQAKLPEGNVHFIDDSKSNADVARLTCGWESHHLEGEQAITAQLRAWWPQYFR